MSNCPFSCSAVAKGKPDLLWNRVDEPVRASKNLSPGLPRSASRIRTCKATGLQWQWGQSWERCPEVWPLALVSSRNYCIFPVGTIALLRVGSLICVLFSCELWLSALVVLSAAKVISTPISWYSVDEMSSSLVFPWISFRGNKRYVEVGQWWKEEVW